MGNVNLKFVLCVIGMVLVIEGLPYFAFPEKLKTYFLKISTVPVSTLRLFGFLAMISGLLLVYWGTR